MIFDETREFNEVHYFVTGIDRNGNQEINNEEKQRNVEHPNEQQLMVDGPDEAMQNQGMCKFWHQWA